MSLSNIEMKAFIHNFVKDMNNNNTSLFVGAGLSIDSGGLNWKELLKKDAEAVGLDVEKETDDLVTVAQYIFNETGSRNTISQLIKNKIKTDGKKNEKHKIISSLPIDTIWTTNYDHYLENAYRDIGKIIDVKKSVNDMSLNSEEAEVSIYKMHGDVTIPESAILIKDDYEIYDRKNEVFINKLKSDLISKTFLFIGFSFDDPNLRNILSKVRVMLEGNTKRHYCIMKKINESECSSNQDYNYKKNKERLFKNDLMRYGIKVIYINEYNDLEKVLQQLKDLYLARKVFVSGAYIKNNQKIEDAKVKINNGEADSFCELLGERLSEENFIVKNALSPGVGRNLVTGYINYELKVNIKKTRFEIYPFPKNMSDKKTYRQDILSDCGAVIYIFGNKCEEQEVVISDGMIEEYEISKELNLYNLPVKETGWAANEIYRREATSIQNEDYKTISDLVEGIINKLKENIKDKGDIKWE